VCVDAPDVPIGAWEFYTVVDDDPSDTGPTPAASCCTTASTDTGPCCGANAPEV
jgi:hypothetical protein